MPWSVARLDASSEAAYAALVAADPVAPAFHTLRFRDALRELGDPHYLVATRDGEVRAALPTFIRRSASGTVANALPFVQSPGGVIGDPGAAPALFAALRPLADVVVIVGAPYRADADFGAPPDFTMTRTTHLSDLAHDTPRPSTQWTVRKVARSHPRLREDEPQVAWQLYAGSMAARQVRPHPFPILRAMGARFVWAELDGRPASSLILLQHNQVLDYYCVGNSEEGRRQQVGSWLVQQELDRARAAGVRHWNWGVSPSPAIHDFKKRWGGQDRVYHIRGWHTGDVTVLGRLNPAQLAAEFPYYFVLPHGP